MSRRYAEGFQSVFDFHRPRSWLAAVGFYVFHLVVVIVISVIIAQTLAVVLNTNDLPRLKYIAARAAQGVALIYPATLYALIIYSRKTWKNPWYILGFAATVGLSIYKASILGLLPSAITLGIRIRKRSAKEAS